jgi:hypothetical protein
VGAIKASQLSLNQAQKINFNMNNISNIFGARAKIFLQYDGDMETLANLLSTRLLIPKLNVETDQDPPHELSGLCEAFVFNIWLNNSEEYPDFAFEVFIETKLKFEESFNDQVYNISPWFARHVSTACQLISCAVGIDGKILCFKDGEINE